MEKLEPLTVKIFYSYAQTKADQPLKGALEKHLTTLARQGQIVSWSKDNIPAGSDEILEISKNLENTDIILSLISPDFIYLEHESWKKSIEIHKTKGTVIVPIIIRPILQTKDMFLDLKVLPNNGESISTSSNRETIFVKVAEEIQKIVRIILIEKYLRKAEEAISGKQPSKSLIYCEEAINMDNAVSTSFFIKGNALYSLKRYKEALESYKKAIELNPKEATYYDKYGDILCNNLERYKDAIYAYRISIELNPKEPSYHDKIGDILYNYLEVPKDALHEYIQASELNPKEPSYHDKIGGILTYYGHYEDAVLAYKRASQLNPQKSSYYFQIGSILDKWLKRPEEAIDIYKEASKLNPEEPSYHRRIGDLLFYKLERYAEAVYSYKRASELNPEEPSYYDLQAQIYEKLAQQMRKKAAEIRGGKK